MPTTLPVPSKGALRTLRNLALGTSCTVVFSAGLLTEDRRRRIHAAREVHDNAKKLKSSRKYHSAGTTALETFEDQIMRYRDDAFWLPSNVSKSTATAPIDRVVQSDGPKLGNSMPQAPPQPSTPVQLPRYNTQRPKASWKSVQARSSASPLIRLPYAAATIPKQQLHNRQHKLAFDVTKLLKENPADVDAAACRFFDAFEEGLPIGGSGIIQPLADAAVELSKACRDDGKFETSARIFDVVLRNGPISEDHFYLFAAPEIIRRLITHGSSGGSLLDPEKLRKASAIYVSKFKEKPKTMTQEMLSIGEKLCQETCRSKMYDLTLDIYTRLESCRGPNPLRAVHHLIIATHGKGHHKKMFRYFQKFYTQTYPDQLQFYRVTGLVIDSVLEIGKMDQAEEVLAAATRMAETGALSISTTWLLKVLGHEWRTNRDVVQLQSLFERLEPLSAFSSHPQALYGAMIQFCVEARDETLALSYYDKLRQTHDLTPNDFRIYGHFALAKAYRKDWGGVKDDFRKMKQLNPLDDDTFSDVFTPVAKEFAKSHSVNELEEFVQFFVDNLELKTTIFLMNVMVEAYSRAKELDAIFRWINYAASNGCSINAATFNIILHNCAHTWQFSFQEVYSLYEAVRGLHCGGSNLVDNETVTILRQIAMAKSPDASETNRRLQLLKNHDEPVQSLDSNGVYRAMSMTYAKGNPTATLKVYKHAKLDHVPLGSKHLGLAVRASLQLHGQNISEAARLIQDAQLKRIKIVQAVTAVFIHQMTALHQDGPVDLERVANLTHSTISTFELCGIKVPQSIVTHTASVLQKRGHNRSAIDLWDTMSRRLGIPPSSFDVPALTTLLQAYLQLQDHTGVQWIMNMLSSNNLCPDRHFKEMLKNTRRETTRLLESRCCSDSVHKFYDSVIEALRVIKEMRKVAVRDKKQVSIKVIKIIETAIEVQNLRDGISQMKAADNKGLERDMDLPRSFSHGHNGQAEDNWIESDSELSPGVTFPPQRLVGAVAA